MPVNDATLIPQCFVPTIETPEVMTRRGMQFAHDNLDFLAPQNPILVADTWTKIFDNVTNNLRQDLARVVVQNEGAFPVRWTINGQADAGALARHGTLAACSAAADGLGSVLKLNGFKGTLWVRAVGGGAELEILIAYPPR